MSAIAIGSVFMMIGGIVVGVNNFESIPLMIGLVVILVGITFQMYGINKIELTISDMREEYIDLFNHSDEWSTSYDHPEIVKPEDIQGSESIDHMSSCKHIDRIDTLNGSENN